MIIMITIFNSIMIIPNTIIPFRTGRVAFDAMGDRLFAEYKVEDDENDKFDYAVDLYDDDDDDNDDDNVDDDDDDDDSR